jgi:anti-sigma factor RsiW
MPHLTEEQIDELLMGSLEPAEAASLREHAATCEACASQLAELESHIASFKAVSLAWSERRSATLPVRPAAKRSGVRWGMGFVWGSVAAAALLAAIIPVLRHEQNVRVQEAYNKARMQGTSQPAIAAQPANSDTAQYSAADNGVPENAQDIAKDNQLLAMVDAELNAPIPTPGSTMQGRKNTPANIQD